MGRAAVWRPGGRIVASPTTVVDIAQPSFGKQEEEAPGERLADAKAFVRSRHRQPWLGAAADCMNPAPEHDAAETMSGRGQIVEPRPIAAGGGRRRTRRGSFSVATRRRSTRSALTEQASAGAELKRRAKNGP